MTSSIKQWKTAQDGLENLKIEEAPMPSPSDGEVLVEIHAVSLNYRDTEVAMGIYMQQKSEQGKPALVPCADMCGIVKQVGNDASPWQVGDRVLSTFNQTHLTGHVKASDMPHGLGLPLPGVLATYRVFPTYGLVKAPSYMTDEEASTLPIASVTAWMAMNEMRPMGQNGGKGEYVLLQGTGGVSIAGLQIAKASGATVLITSSSEEKLAQAKTLGADIGINYRSQPEWQDAVLQATQDNGADIIFENGGAQTLRKSFDCIAFGGLIDCIGYLSGKVDAAEDKTSVNVLALRRNVTVKGIMNGPRDRFEEMIAFYEKHQIRPVVNRVFPFEESKKAFQYIYSGSHFGKVVIKVKALGRGASMLSSTKAFGLTYDVIDPSC